MRNLFFVAVGAPHFVYFALYMNVSQCIRSKMKIYRHDEIELSIIYECRIHVQAFAKKTRDRKNTPKSLRKGHSWDFILSAVLTALFFGYVYFVKPIFCCCCKNMVASLRCGHVYTFLIEYNQGKRCIMHILNRFPYTLQLPMIASRVGP